MRSSHQTFSTEKTGLKNFAIYPGKHMCWGFFIKKRLQHLCEYCEFFKSTCERLLLSINLSTQFISKATTLNHFNCLILFRDTKIGCFYFSALALTPWLPSFYKKQEAAGKLQKNQIMLGERRHVFRGLRVKEPLMNLQKYLKEGFPLAFLIHAYLSFKDNLD